MAKSVLPDWAPAAEVSPAEPRTTMARVFIRFARVRMVSLRKVGEAMIGD